MANGGKSVQTQESQGRKKVNNMPRIDLDDPRPSRFQKLQVSSIGHVRIGKYTVPGWKEPREFFLFLCPKHGYVTNHLKGFDQGLICSECFKEATTK